MSVSSFRNAGRRRHCITRAQRRQAALLFDLISGILSRLSPHTDAEGPSRCPRKDEGGRMKDEAVKSDFIFHPSSFILPDRSPADASGGSNHKEIHLAALTMK